MNTCIRKASKGHFAALREIELASSETLRAAGAVTGEAAASSDEDLQKYLDDDLLFAAFDNRNIPVGFGGGYVAENWLHIGEVDVHPNWQRMGIGRRLVTALLDEGRARKLKGSTLTTDRFAPFNAPFYASAGFHLVEGDACSARLKAILLAEYGKGLDPVRRVAMRLLF